MDEYYRAVKALPAWLAAPLAQLPAQTAVRVQELRLRIGCAVTFTVYSDSDTALLDVRYSAGTEAAQRTLLVNGESILLDLPKTQDWDSWNKVSVPVELLPGQNTITISYQAGNFAGINLDCISLRNQ